MAFVSYIRFRSCKKVIKTQVYTCFVLALSRVHHVEFAADFWRRRITCEPTRSLRLAITSRLYWGIMREVLARMPAWTQNAQTQAEVKVLVLDTLWQSLPRPPFTDQETEELAERVYDYVWQRSAS